MIPPPEQEEQNHLLMESTVLIRELVTSDWAVLVEVDSDKFSKTRRVVVSKSLRITERL